VGDLNADCTYLKETDPMALRGLEHVWIVSDDADTNVSATHCAYDRVILTPSTVEDFT
jgi:deoxyribonuclease-1-like protein